MLGEVFNGISMVFDGIGQVLNMTSHGLVEGLFHGGKDDELIGQSVDFGVMRHSGVEVVHFLYGKLVPYDDGFDA